MHTVTVTGERAAEWVKVFGSATVPVQSPFPVTASVQNEITLVYMLAIDQLTPDQRGKLIDHLATKFNLHAAEVSLEIDRVGVPILYNDTVMQSDSNPLAWIDDDLEIDDYDERDDWGICPMCSGNGLTDDNSLCPLCAGDGIYPDNQ